MLGVQEREGEEKGREIVCCRERESEWERVTVEVKMCVCARVSACVYISTYVYTLSLMLVKVYICTTKTNVTQYRMVGMLSTESKEVGLASTGIGPNNHTAMYD